MSVCMNCSQHDASDIEVVALHKSRTILIFSVVSIFSVGKSSPGVVNVSVYEL